MVAATKSTITFFEHWSITYLYRNIWKLYWTEIWILISHPSSKYYMQYTECHFFFALGAVEGVCILRRKVVRTSYGERIVCLYFRVCVCWHIASVTKSTSYSKCGNFTEHVRAPPHITSSNKQAKGFLESIPKKLHVLHFVTRFILKTTPESLSLKF